MIDAMTEGLRAGFEALTADGRCEVVEGRAFVPLLTLESEMRYGLALRDEELVWARAQDGAPGKAVLIFVEPGAEVRFVELVEHERDELESRVAAASEALGLDGAAAVASLPVLTIVGGLLNGRAALFCRQALRWLRPTELRPLRDAIAGVAEDRSLPQDVRSLAERLTVPP